MISNAEFNTIATLDLDPIKVKLMHKESGEGWPVERAKAAEFEYRRFLCLSKLYPNEQMAPLLDVDTFWHYHILDTMKYAADCERVFGYFLHHFPYVGLGGEEDDAAHQEAGACMKDRYQATFGQAEIDQDEAQGATAWCSVTGKTAWCSVTGKTAWCSLTGKAASGSVLGKTAWCSATGKTAWCSLTGKAASASITGKTAWCSATGKTAWCSVTGKTAAGAVTGKTAWCSVTGKTAAGAVTGKTAWCSVTGKTAWCSIAGRAAAKPALSIVASGVASPTARFDTDRVLAMAA